MAGLCTFADMFIVLSSSFYLESTEVPSFFLRCFCYLCTRVSHSGMFLIWRKEVWVEEAPPSRSHIDHKRVVSAFLDVGQCPRSLLVLPLNPHTELLK